MPPLPAMLLPELQAYCERLQLLGEGGLAERHLDASHQVKSWIHGRLLQGLPAELIVVCTGNSRRSILGSTLGNVAAAFGGHGAVRFYSGGTAPSAFNLRTIRTLREIGTQIEEQGELAPSGTSGEANPCYSVRWGATATSRAIEFSKRYDDATNPQQDYCAIMVCTDADENCPVVLGASVRVSMPFDDPQEFDGEPTEPAAYAERRDQIGRVMLRLFDH